MGEVPPVKIVEPVAVHSNPEPPYIVRNDRGDAVIRRTIGVLGVMVKMRDALSIQPVQPATVGSCPDCAMRVPCNITLRAGTQAAGVIGIGEVVREGLPIEAIQTPFRCNPKRACGTDCDSSDDIAAWAFGVVEIVAISRESFRPACQPVDPGSAHADPERAGRIHIQSAPVYNVAAQTGWIVGSVQVTSKRSALAIHQIQAIVGPHPEASRLVLKRDRHKVVA